MRDIRRRGATWKMAHGMHEPLVARVEFELVRRRIGERRRPRAHDCTALSNRFAGLIYCAACGHAARALRRRGALLYDELSDDVRSDWRRIDSAHGTGCHRRARQLAGDVRCACRAL